MTNSIPKFIDGFSQLIAMPSVSSIDPLLDQSNKGVVELLANWLQDLDFKVELMPVSDKPEKLNLIAYRGTGKGGLVLSGHTDTVPFNGNSWQQDPFVLTEKENKLYGLGAADMKCFFPLIIDTIQQLDVKEFKQPLIILATADEESTMAGARVLSESGKTLGRHALIGEPTGLIPIYMHKGILLEIIKLSGQAGHASDPALGNSALEGMHAVINALMEWRSELQEMHQNNEFKVPVPTLNFGSIHGGDNPNRICAECELSLDLRLLPGMDIEQVRSDLRLRANQAIAGSGLLVDFNPIFGGVPSMKTDINSDIIKLAEKLSGHSSSTVAFGTEGPYLNSMGMDTVILGPGDIDQAHQANEYIAMERFTPMLDILSQMIGHFCIEGKSHVN